MGKIVRSIAEDGSVMMCAIDATDIVSQAEQFHHTSAVVTAALGRALAAGSMMGAMLKGKDDSLTLRIKGDGPVGSIVVASDSAGNVRGSVGNPLVELPLNAKGKLDVAGAVGSGNLYVIRDVGLREPYIGQTELVSGEIAEDITHYYAVSEQIPTVCGLGVLVNTDLTVLHAGGFLIQLLPGAGDETIDRLEANINTLPPVTAMLSAGLTPEQICEKALAGFAPQVLDTFPVSYRCTCTRERVEKMLISLGERELQDIIDDGETTHVECHFCDRTYAFTVEQLRALMQRAKG